VLGPDIATETLPLATFVIERVPHALVAARLSAEFAIGVRHGCFCAHPYLVRLLGLRDDELEAFRSAARHHDRRSLPGAVRASAGISTTTADVDRLLDAVHAVATTDPPVEYVSDPASGDYWPKGFARPCEAVHA
jgi:selenocysteine lyase/cysteine desulfurase